MSAFAFASAVGIQSNHGLFIQFDLKAMRKVDVGSDLVEVVESDAGSSGCVSTSYTRALIKLH